MANDDLISRVQRLYAAIGATEETDISKFMPKVISDGNRGYFYQDWSGGRSDVELAIPELPPVIRATLPAIVKVGLFMIAC